MKDVYLDYKVSQKVDDIYNQLIALEQVQAGMEFIKSNEEETIQDLIDLTLIEAPTFHERKRAEYFAECLRKLGLEDVTIDEHCVVSGVRRGSGTGPRVVVDAHTDTVFPIGTVKEVRREGDVLYAPGIGDDTSGLATILGVIRGLNASGIQTKGDLVFTGTPREEGMGMLGGMRDYLNDHHEEVDAVLALDCDELGAIIYDAAGMRTAEVNFYGIGGHAVCFGEMASPSNAAAIAVAKICRLEIPKEPWTILCVSNIHAGNDAGIHAIPPKATIKYNIRSTSPEVLEDLDNRIAKCIQEACDEETAYWGKDTITWDHKLLCSAPAGVQSLDVGPIQAVYRVAQGFGAKPFFRTCGCTNASHAIAHGIPAVCMARSNYPEGMEFDTKAHNLDECVHVKDYYKVPQEVFLTALMCAGVEGATDSVL